MLKTAFQSTVLLGSLLVWSLPGFTEGQESQQLPFDSASAEVTILAKDDGKWQIRLDRILEYKRYPKATYPGLQEGEKRAVFVSGLLEPNNPHMGQGKPTPTIGKAYRAGLHVCYSKEAGYNCKVGEDWIAFLSSLEPTTSAGLKIIRPEDRRRILAGESVAIQVRVNDPLSRNIMLITPWAVEELTAPSYKTTLAIPAEVAGEQKILVIGGDRQSKDDITIIVSPRQ